MTRWSEYHVFLHRGAALDAFLTGPLPRLFDRVGGRGWFIRYWLGGPHIRVRIPADRDSPAAAQLLRDAASDHAGGTALTPTAFYAGHSFDGVPVDAGTLPWFADGTVRSVAHVSETALYGEGETLRGNEAFFCDASRLALRLLAVADVALLPRVAADLLLGAYAHLGDRADDFTRAYRGFLRPFGSDARERSRAPGNSGIGQPGQAWRAMLQRYEARAEQPLRRFVLHQHLLMNRLGIAPRHEALLFDTLQGEIVHG